MPRPPRPQFAGAVYHVTARGVDRRLVFLDDRDYEAYLWIAGKRMPRLGLRCHAFCLMPNHLHLLVETARPNIAAAIQLINGVYAQRFNRRHERRGHLFESRYGAVVVKRESHLLEACRYIPLNPVRASLCERPMDWRWSSYCATAGLAPCPPFLKVDWLLDQLSESRARARARYVELVAEGRTATALRGTSRGLTPGRARAG